MRLVREGKRKRNAAGSPARRGGALRWRGGKWEAKRGVMPREYDLIPAHPPSPINSLSPGLAAHSPPRQSG